jgi:hypothetical protein
MKKQLNARQEAKLNAYHSTEQHVDANIAIIAAIVAFMATYNKIKANIAAIFDFEQEKSASLTGIAAGKIGVRLALCELAAVIAGLVNTYADDVSDAQLREEMNVPESRLTRTRDDELAPLCQFIHDRAEANLDALDDYNISAAKLAELQTLIDAYRAEVSKPRTAVKTRKITNANLAEVFADTDKLFKKFDKQIESLRKQNPDFVNAYFATREITDPATKQKNTETKNKDTHS